MSKSDSRAEKKVATPSKKRKLTEAEEEEYGTAAAVPKKAKKSKQDKGKGDKKKSHKERKAEQAEALNHEEFDVEDEAIDVDAVVKGGAAVEEEKKKSKKSKKEKKEKKNKVEEATETTTTVDEEEGKKKSKKDKKAKKAKSGEDDHPVEEAEGDTKKTKKGKKAKKEQEGADGEKESNVDAVNEDDSKPGKNNRFICFIGNLPYTATQADIKAHFAALKPTSVRLLTERSQPSKSRGIAFVEFDNYAHMKTCLAKFHHTELTDAKGSTRRINVELTAGGGGKTEGRMDKVAEKNRRLNEQRGRRIAKEEQEKLENAKARAGKEVVQKDEDREEQMVHPSRRAHVPGRRS
ncbi:Nop6, putative RNA-binding protein implicated in ribosome biogenesis [Cryphonectria parasitica EP155]|uniref:Nop6, putative RNA-binding protein implicated in ribosome biogenesis n=1 Tax=Cryphonectria parasitica (strain ATCC 38755 / EP155) TaxID=660469 RepID=A0A9P4Y236_CRYP1|nr:Nop6, putative RNA-binding protein implicated in ribosome biogenesis [Cryphonectria parasitica EP155]KAF3765253.1 Nop6, putative RNA-binding protein implicated in ribosome biogenesis [Cryphonectria parasitica EP155]